MCRLFVLSLIRTFSNAKSFGFLNLLCAVAMLGCVLEPQGGPVVVVVGDRHITARTFKAEMAFAREDLPLTEDLEKGIRKKLLNQIVDRYLVLEYAKRHHITISKTEFRQRLDDLKAGYSSDAFQAALVRAHLTPSIWKNRVREDLLIQKVVQEVLKDLNPPSFEDMKVHFEEHTGQFTKQKKDYGELIREIEQRVIEQKKASLFRDWLNKLRAEIPVRINREALDKMELS